MLGPSRSPSTTKKPSNCGNWKAFLCPTEEESKCLPMHHLTQLNINTLCQIAASVSILWLMKNARLLRSIRRSR